MDFTKAQRLLLKIQAFMDNGNGSEISRLEKDLMKSYIIQLYDAVSTEEAPAHTEKPRQVEIPVAKFQKPEAPPVYIPEIPKPEPPKPEPEEPVYHEPVAPKIPDVPLEIKIPVQEPVFELPKFEPVDIPVVEPVKEVVHEHKFVSTPADTSDELAKLFELPKVEEMSGRFSHIPIDNIEAALGLNERIFTLNELFGGNRDVFESTCAKLNNLSSFTEAKHLLLSGPARQYKWSDQERVKMAEHFIRIVARRYPKS
jgi:hypothetical protein